MTHTSRRTLLSAIAASATVPLSALATAPSARAAQGAVATAQGAAAAAHGAATAAPSAAAAGPSGLAGPASSVTMTALDASWFTQVTLESELTATVLPGSPARTEVTSAGRRVALLTHGARTVLVPGPRRTFTEDKQPFAEDFGRTLPDPALAPSQRVYWGNSPGGGTWETHGPVAGDFSVTPGRGLIALTTDGASRYCTLKDDGITDVDVEAVAGFDKVPTGDACSFALVFGYTSPDSHHRVRLSFLTTGAVELRLEKVAGGNATALAAPLTLATGVPARTAWGVRVLREGARIRVKAWRASAGQPGAWHVDVVDSPAVTGRVGLRALANQGCTSLPVTLAVTGFRVVDAAWEAPPSVTHGDWVRVLPEPFDGTWTPALEQTVRGWIGSPAPDVLAYAAMFLPGAPAVSAGAGPAAGRKVLGEATYSPAGLRGERTVGADFHEFAGVGWTFPNGTVRAADPAFAGSLDCSGYTRMVYGYHLGVPVADVHDASPARLPRTSAQMADRAPGVRLARTTGSTAQVIALLQPGDLLLWDADEDGEVDHVGIHLGADALGKARFLSSRKTVNGPTMADVGGASLLDGGGTYDRTLHTVHRL
ncbi:NlpC/P60 family protein [Streptomyces sp. NPDC090022]|uniref:NlpC/P60 family protein n=1 Tax=Streptomyces sp. NPDC090022 TaxID=3365920 RepID=UPI003802333C